jgi:hypothetical protein
MKEKSSSKESGDFFLVMERKFFYTRKLVFSSFALFPASKHRYGLKLKKMRNFFPIIFFIIKLIGMRKEMNGIKEESSKNS